MAGEDAGLGSNGTGHLSDGQAAMSPGTRAVHGGERAGRPRVSGECGAPGCWRGVGWPRSRATGRLWQPQLGRLPRHLWLGGAGGGCWLVAGAPATPSPCPAACCRLADYANCPDGHIHIPQHGGADCLPGRPRGRAGACAGGGGAAGWASCTAPAGAACRRLHWAASSAPTCQASMAGRPRQHGGAGVACTRLVPLAASCRKPRRASVVQEGRYGSYEYGRYGNPTTRACEEKIRALEVRARPPPAPWPAAEAAAAVVQRPLGQPEPCSCCQPQPCTAPAHSRPASLLKLHPPSPSPSPPHRAPRTASSPPAA